MDDVKTNTNENLPLPYDPSKLASFYQNRLPTLDIRAVGFVCPAVTMPPVNNQRFSKISVEDYQTLQHMEVGALGDEMYHTLSSNIKDVLIRRREVLYAPHTVLMWAGSGMGDMQIAHALGFFSFKEVQSWAKKVDPKDTTGLAAALLSVYEIIGQFLFDQAINVANTIGSMTATDEEGLAQEINLASLALKHQQAVMEDDSARAFMLAQTLPTAKEALAFDTQRKNKVIDLLVRKATAYASNIYGSTATKASNTANAGQLVSININASPGAEPSAVQPSRVVNPTPNQMPLVPGYTIDSG